MFRHLIVWKITTTRCRRMLAYKQLTKRTLYSIQKSNETPRLFWEFKAICADSRSQGELEKEESIAIASTEKLLEDEGYTFKKISKGVYESDGYVEKEWYEPRGPDSLLYFYSEEDVQYILRRRMEKWRVAEEKEVTDLMGDRD